ncbi:hypothetical protein CVT26_002260 [Gymnopilus dilepis]|uniref:Uncharacterized protein n=1 Tax=Gymnopilus dilepis TaxID=231916 RepID=A0A409YX69_9AGAR|nr:hypothetical protein CVT26_002260 [Gymnopilus dilepis]
MVNPGAFRGSHKEFLMSQKPAYAEAVMGGYTADALADIQRKFFKRYPIDLPNDEEPTPEHLAAVDDDAPDPEMEEPNRERLGDAEYEKAMVMMQDRAEKIRFRKAHTKDHDVDPMEPSADNPYNHFIFQLSGKEPGRPRKKMAVNVWRKSQCYNIEMRTKNLAKVQGVRSNRLAALRDKVAREMFQALPLEQQEKWAKRAEEETAAAIKERERCKKSEPSTKPEDRQVCISGLVRVMQPLLDIVHKSTGWNVTLMAGGPEPAHAGKLNIISVHSGLTPGEVKMNFGRAERADYKKYFVPVFRRFLKKCFSPEECRARGLDDTEGLPALAVEEVESSGANLDSLEDVEDENAQSVVDNANTSIISTTSPAVTSSSPVHSSGESSPAASPTTSTSTVSAALRSPASAEETHTSMTPKTCPDSLAMASSPDNSPGESLPAASPISSTATVPPAQDTPCIAEERPSHLSPVNESSTLEPASLSPEISFSDTDIIMASPTDPPAQDHSIEGLHPLSTALESNPPTDSHSSPVVVVQSPCPPLPDSELPGASAPDPHPPTETTLNCVTSGEASPSQPSTRVESEQCRSPEGPHFVDCHATPPRGRRMTPPLTPQGTPIRTRVSLPPTSDLPPPEGPPPSSHDSSFQTNGDSSAPRMSSAISEAAS